MLKNILCLIDTWVFLSRVGKETSGWLYLELNGIAELLFWFFAHGLLTSLGCFSVFLSARHVEPQGSRDSEPGFATLPPGELLLILVRFLGMEQLCFQSLRKHTAATDCVTGLTRTCCSFHLGDSHCPQQQKQLFAVVGRTHLLTFPGARGDFLCALWSSWLLLEGDESCCGCGGWS